jgi:hypothetical protein
MLGKIPYSDQFKSFICLAWHFNIFYMNCGLLNFDKDLMKLHCLPQLFCEILEGSHVTVKGLILSGFD